MFLQYHPLRRLRRTRLRDDTSRLAMAGICTVLTAADTILRIDKPTGRLAHLREDSIFHQAAIRLRRGNQSDVFSSADIPSPMRQSAREHWHARAEYSHCAQQPAFAALPQSSRGSLSHIPTAAAL